jgi:hypothetical protein
LASSVNNFTIHFDFSIWRFICITILHWKFARELNWMARDGVSISFAYQSFRTGIYCVRFFPLRGILTHFSYRWMVRSAYGIGDPLDCWEDCVLSAFCTCCVINQLYQTTSAKGNPTVDGGQQFNVNYWISDTSVGCDSCIYACFCMPCSMGTILQDSVGMPFLMGCCFFNVFNTRNVVRYHYRISRTPKYNSDCLEECLRPLAHCLILGKIASTCILCPWLTPCPFAAYSGFMVLMNVMLMKESKMRRSGENHAYMRGYNPLIPIPTSARIVPVANPVHYEGPDSLQQPFGYNPVPVEDLWSCILGEGVRSKSFAKRIVVPT